MHSEHIDQIKISIVMPVYNTGAYLEEALESVFAQSFQEFELICVDDASNDKLTKCILEKFQNQYENMRVIRTDSNIGAGEARNSGLLQACGEYVIFLDADDVFADDMLKRMYQSVCENHADVCICGYQAFYIENGRKYFGEKCLPDGYKINSVNREDWFLDISTEPWNKLCRIQFLKEYGIYFQSIPSCNDVFYSCMVMANAEKRCYVGDEVFVFYRTKVGTQISVNRNPIDLYKAIMLVNTSAGRMYNGELLIKWSSALLIRNGIGELSRCSHEDSKRQFYYLLREYFIKNEVVFRNKVLNAFVEHLRGLSYESGWFYGCMEFVGQLRLTVSQLRKELGKNRELYLWGLGCRGEAFQQLCREEGIHLHGVADIADDKVGKRTKYGNEIVSITSVLQSKGFVIASNKKIYDDLIRMDVGLDILNLEEYCPM